MRLTLESMWNANLTLSQTYKWVLHKKLSFTKNQCVAFYKASYKLHGTCGTYTIPKENSRPSAMSREGLISMYSCHTGMFGSYAAWLGYSVSYFLKRAGYAPLSKLEQKRYKCF